MQIASLNEIKKELLARSQSEVVELLLKVGKYKKENKELLSYLLFEAENEQGYIENVKELLDVQFEEINKNNLYTASKGIRKTLRTANKFIKYSGKKTTEIEILIHCCNKIKSSGIRWRTSTALVNVYNRLIIKIEKAIPKLHEDLQFDYKEELSKLI